MHDEKKINPCATCPEIFFWQGHTLYIGRVGRVYYSCARFNKFSELEALNVAQYCRSEEKIREEKKMKIGDNLRASGEFVKATDYQEGDMFPIEFGKNFEEQTGQKAPDGTDYKDSLVADVKLKDGIEKKLRLSRQNVTRLCDLFGEDTDAWIGKKVRLQVVRYDTLAKLGFKVLPAEKEKQKK